MRSQIVELIPVVAEQMGVDPILLRALVEIESSYQFDAIRFERNFYFTYVYKKLTYKKLKREIPNFRKHNVSRDTEEFLRACSLGLCQIMGQVARERGFDGRLIELIVNPELNLIYGCKQLLHLGARYNDQFKIIHAYNAGTARGDSSDNPYVVKVWRVMNRLRENGIE